MKNTENIDKEKRKILKKAYVAPVLIILGSLTKDLDARGHHGGDHSCPHWGHR